MRLFWERSSREKLDQVEKAIRKNPMEWERVAQKMSSKHIQTLLERIRPEATVWVRMIEATHLDQGLWDFLVSEVPEDVLVLFKKAPEGISQQLFVRRVIAEYREKKQAYTRLGTPGQSDRREFERYLSQTARMLVASGGKEGWQIRETNDVELAGMCVGMSSGTDFFPACREILPVCFLNVGSALIMFDTIAMNIHGQGKPGRQKEEYERFLSEILDIIGQDEAGREWQLHQPTRGVANSIVPDGPSRGSRKTPIERLRRQISNGGVVLSPFVDLWIRVATRNPKLWLEMLAFDETGEMLKYMPEELWQAIPLDLVVKGLAYGPSSVKPVLFARLGQLRGTLQLPKSRDKV